MNSADEKKARFFEPLEQIAYQNLEHAAYLKGLLNPFKGKRALEEWASQCERLRDQLIDLADQQILNQVNLYPFALLPVRLMKQTSMTGTVFLRWCTPKKKQMGTHLWEALIQSSQTPAYLLEDLYVLERQRIIFNMQISSLQSMMRQALDCAEKMNHAQEIFEAQQTTSTLKEKS